MSNELAKAPSNEVTVKTSAQSLMAAQKQYIDNIGKGMESIIGSMSTYQSLCGYNVLDHINTLLAKEGLKHTSINVDKESLNNAIKFAVVYGLNTDNREVFCIVRNERRTNPVTKKEYWVKKIEIKPQYKGTIKMISHYGRNVKKVYPEWIVREGDEFTYATFKGVEVVPPTWTPKSADGKVVRVVVPVEYEDGFIDYRIAERESVATNIKAQIKQSLMFDKEKGAALNELIKDYTLDQLFACEQIKGYINSTYTGLSREEMIITKLVLNATKRVGIDYEKALPTHANVARELNEKTFDNADVYVKDHSAKELLEQQETPYELETHEIEEVTSKKDTVSEPAVDDNGVVEEAAPVEDKKLSIDDLFSEDDRPF